MVFASYEKVPENVAQKIIAERSGKMKEMDAE
jgi:hypothetical protein